MGATNEAPIYPNCQTGTWLYAALPTSGPSVFDGSTLYTSDWGWVTYQASSSSWVRSLTYNNQTQGTIPPPVVPTPFVLAVGAPNVRSLALATAYQATDPTKPAIITLNLNSSANISLTGGTVNTADLLMGATAAVASGTGTVSGKYANSNTGTLTIGLNVSTIAGYQGTLIIPTGWYFAIRQTAGTISIVSAFDQSIG